MTVILPRSHPSGWKKPRTSTAYEEVWSEGIRVLYDEELRIVYRVIGRELRRRRLSSPVDRETAPETEGSP